jgi:hypothetical protein
MPWLPDREDKDRHASLYDDKIRWLDLVNTKLEPPEGIGIFDEPVRCYRINKKWAKFLTGIVLWLADMPIWANAQDEGYSAIEEFLRFLVGEDCMAFELRQSPDDSCILQQSLDGGETWTDVFDFSLCLDAQLASTESTLTNIYQQNLTNSGFDVNISVVNDYNTPQELQDVGAAAETCDTAGKDAIYGACRSLVDYIHAVNLDVLQEIGQAANLPDQVNRLISAIPGVGLLPFDEAFSYAAFLVNELTDEYNATVDEELLQNVTCDLFCLSVANNCRLDMFDVFNYFSGKFPGELSTYTTTLAQMVQFAITGTFTGDDYFYFLCAFQLLIAGLDQKILSNQGFTPYAMQIRAGLNSPDNDWSIFCVDCPDFEFWVLEHDFRHAGLGDFYIQTIGSTVRGNLTSNGVESAVNTPGVGEQQESIAVILNFDVPYDIETMDALWKQEVQSSGSANLVTFQGASAVDFVTIIANYQNHGFVGSATPVDQKDCNEVGVAGAFNCRSVRYFLNCEEGFDPKMTLQKIRIVGRDNGNGKPVGSVWRETIPDCDEFVL